MTRMRLIGTALLLSCSIPPAAADPGASVWSIDFVDVKAGELENYLSFVRQNWAENRKLALRDGKIVSYKMVVMDKDLPELGGTDVLLMTEYPTAQAYADREAIFAPIMKNRTMVKINGKTSRDFVQSIRSVSGR